MDSQFRNKQISFLVTVIGVAGILFGIHWYLLSHFAKETVLFFPLWQIYAFHLVITALIYFVVSYRQFSGKSDVFNTFMVATFLKMIVAIVFLLPLISSKFENKQPDVFNFFIPYFLFLIFEVFSITKLLQKK
jgi:cobalamin synthase